jgi:hypothetical protein
MNQEERETKMNTTYYLEEENGADHMRVRLS